MGWEASLDLEYYRRDCEQVAYSKHKGPLTVQKAFRVLDQDHLQQYILHPPGGLVGGDHIDISVRAGEGTHILLTSPSAQKVYRSQSDMVYSDLTISCEDGATLFWLPQESILFEGSKLRQRTKIMMHRNTRLLYWDIQALGRQSIQEGFEKGSFHVLCELYRDHELSYVDATRLDPESNILQANMGLRGFHAQGQFFCSVGELDLEALRGLIVDPTKQGMSFVDGILIVRMMSEHGWQIKDFFIEIIRALDSSKGLGFVEPRIWDC